ncbi:MAG: hypothetical protein EOP86_24990 [Verrucomicrobiaceae bacterium]|nr:MAG: hypothetical protein EOP86_24990 [Verrucomicrobiaceae bacterium]
MNDNPKSPLPPPSTQPADTEVNRAGNQGGRPVVLRFCDGVARVLDGLLSRLFPVAGQGAGADRTVHSSVGRMTLKSFLKERWKPGVPFWCDLVLVSEHDAAHIAAWLSDVFALRFHPLDNDDYWGFKATLDRHEILLMQEPDDVAEGLFSFNIQPGWHRLDEGPVQDLEEDMRRWLSASAPAMGVSIVPD